MTYAGFWARLFAGLLDCFIAMIFVIGLGLLIVVSSLLIDIPGPGRELGRFVLYSSDLASPNGKNWYILGIASHVWLFLNSSVGNGLFAIALALEEWLPTSSKIQGTFGKKILNIYVGNKDDGSRISKPKSFVRFFLKWLSLLIFPITLFSSLMVIFSKEKASLHDRICGTRTFRGRPN